MGRRRKAWLWKGTGKRIVKGRALPGYYVGFNTYDFRGQRVGHTKNFLTRAAALKWIRLHNARQDLQATGDLIPIPFDEAVKEFLRGCSALAPATVGIYTQSLGFLGDALAEGVEIATITGREIDRFVAARSKKRSPATAAKHIASLRVFFRWCIKQRYLESSPIGLAGSLPRQGKRRDRPAITEEQLALLVDSLDTEDRRVAVWLAMTTGLDRQVIARLSAAQVDLDNAAIVITRPKTGRRFAVPIHSLLLPFLRERAAQTCESRPLLQGLARQQRHRDWWAAAAAAAGVPSLLFRDLRAMAASRAIRLGGMALTDAQQLLGHASPATTAKHYVTPSTQLRSAFERLSLPGSPPLETPTKA